MRYFDLQVIGYAGVDFNSNTLTTEEAKKACSALEEDGTEGILATVITDSVEAMKAKIRRIVRAREEDGTESQIGTEQGHCPLLGPAGAMREARPVLT